MDNACDKMHIHKKSFRIYYNFKLNSKGTRSAFFILSDLKETMHSFYHTAFLNQYVSTYWKVIMARKLQS